MARIFTSGFELNSINTGTEWTSPLNTPTIQSTITRSGSFALKCVTSGSIVGMNQTFVSAGITSGYYARAYFCWTSIPITNNPNNMAFMTSAGFETITVQATTAGKFRLFDSTNNAQIGSDSTFTINLGQWYRVELFIDMTTPASCVATAKVDGVQIATGTTNQTGKTITALRVGSFGVTHSETVYVDDVAINDTTGSFQNSYPGEGSVIHLRPNAPGDSTQWTSTGVNYLTVSNVLPNDNFNNRASVSSNSDDFNIDPTPKNLSPNSTINCVQVGVRYGADTATQANNIVWNVRYKALSGGTISNGSNIQAASTSFFTNANAAPANPTLTLYQTPDSTTLTKYALDNSQIGYTCTVSSGTATASRVSGIWLIVDYVATPANRVENYGNYIAVADGMSRSEVAN